MNNNDTEGDYVCKGRCAKSDRAELTHICPSKLSKRELEDLYFVLFESNLELKRTVNSQRDKIKVLTTKVLRMTAGQKGVRGENPSIRIVEEQKDSIADLKRANAQLEERVKQLNMRLCSAKQFLKRCPAQSTSRTGCNKSFNIPRSAVSVKNPTTCALNVDSADNLRISSATSCQFPNRDLSTTDAQTETMNRDNQDGSVCNDNQCRTRIEELKQKILNLQEELMKTHEEYAARISSLEREVSALQSENMRVVAAHALGERRRQRAGERAGALAARLRDTEAQYSDVSLELTLEKKKVAELETRIKAAQLSSEVLKTLEDHLDTIQSDRVSRVGASKKAPDFAPYDVEIDETKVPVLKNVKDYNCVIIDPVKRVVVEIDHVNKQDNEEQETDSKPAEKKDDKNIPLEQTPVETPISSHEGNETKSKPDQPYTSKNVDKTPASSPHRLKKNIEKPSEKESKNLSKKDNHNSYQIPGPVPANTTKRESRKQPIKKTDVKKPVTERHNTVVEGRKSRASSFSKPNEEPNQNIKKLNSQRTDIVSERKTVEKGVQTDDPSSLEYTQIPKTGTSDTVDWSRSNTCTRLRMPEPPDIGKKLKSLDICSTEEKYVQTENTNEQENTGTSCVPVAVLMLAEEEPPAGAACGRCICCQFHTVAAETTSFQHSNLDKERNENEMKTNQAQSKRVISSCQQDSEPFESCQPEYSGMQQSKINPQNQGMNQRIQFTQTQENQLAQHEIQPTENAQKQAYRNWSQPQYGRMGQEINQGQLNQQFRESPAPKSTSAQTYTLQGSAQQQKGGSPEDTDKEISSYSDLPSERDGRITRQRVQEYSRRSPMSPGEDREFTYTDTDPTSTEQPHSLTLSEGEVLAEGRAKPVSLGEQPTRDVPKSEMSARAGSPQHMQATLAAIGEELARCRRLLQRQRWPECADPKDAAVMVDLSNSSVPLKRAEGKSRIGDTVTPKCIFTLHMGTIVLSDEALMCSRDLPLMLTWQFFDQNISMVRVGAGRVLHFDFSTEYDVKLTDRFLDYLRHEEMPITICEIDKQDKPFAGCALPLREALLHTNQRADMSLALTAGSQMRRRASLSSAARDPLDSGDEVGVLDLWCLLRTPDPAPAPPDRRLAARAARAARAQTASQQTPMRSGTENKRQIPVNNNKVHVMEEIMEGEQSIDDRLFEGLDLNIDKSRKISFTAADNHSMSQMEYEMMLQNQPTLFKKSRKLKENSSEASMECRRDFYKPPQRFSFNEPSIHSNRVADPRSYESEERKKATDIRTSTVATSTPSNMNSNLGYPSMETDRLSRGKRTSHTSLTQKSYVDSELFQNHRNSERWDPRCFMRQQRTSGMILNEVPTNIKSASDFKYRIKGNADESTMTELSSFGQRERNISDPHSSYLSPKTNQFEETMKRISDSSPNKDRNSMNDFLQNDNWKRLSKSMLQKSFSEEKEKTKNATGRKKCENFYNKKSVTIEPKIDEPYSVSLKSQDEKCDHNELSMDITIIWLALNEECSAMNDPKVRRLYVAYSFLGRTGADLETPVSLPKPKCYADKCYYHFKKTFKLHEAELPVLGHLAKCRLPNKGQINPNDCVVFTVVSEPPEDPLGLDNCEDIGNAYLYFGDILACSDGDSYMEVLPVRTVRNEGSVCGVLAVRVDGLDVVRRCLAIADRGMTDI